MPSDCVCACGVQESVQCLMSPPRAVRVAAVGMGDELSPTRGLTDERIAAEAASSSAIADVLGAGFLTPVVLEA